MSERLQRITGIARLTSSSEPFRLECGEAIDPLVIAYESYGNLNSDRSNAILLCHALTGSAHAAGIDAEGRKGWWDGAIGPGKAIDTDRYFVICSNILGGCYGSTGPRSINPLTGSLYGDSFPRVTIRDMVRAQRLLLRHLGIHRLHAVAGGSMGGMQVLEWALLYPEDVDLIVTIAAAPRHSPWRVAFNAIAREAIALGRNARSVEAGLRLARKVAVMTYRSDREFDDRFGRRRTLDDPFAVDGSFAVEAYLDHHAQRIIERFDAATYETITRATDLHDVTRNRAPLHETLASITQPALCVGISSDVLYPTHEVRSLAEMLPNGAYREIDSLCGHDAFLIEYDALNGIVASFLREHPVRAYAECWRNAEHEFVLQS